MLALLRNRLFIGCSLLILLAIVGKVVWKRYGHIVIADPRYRLAESAIVVTDQPDWIQSEVKDSAIRLGKLDQLSLLDPALVSKVDEAFRVQTWVADVERVSKTPKGVVVDLKYRKPVAMVEIETEGTARLQPVDGAGVLLPGAEFSQSQALQFLRIAIPSPRLNGLIDGTVWPDERIIHAAQIAELLVEDRASLRLFRIDMMLNERNVSRRSPIFEIITRNGHRIVWGSAPGAETNGEADAEARLESLRSLEQALTTDSSSSKKEMYDVRTGTVVRIQPDQGLARESSPEPQNPWGLD